VNASSVVTLAIALVSITLAIVWPGQFPALVAVLGQLRQHGRRDRADDKERSRKPAKPRKRPPTGKRPAAARKRPGRA